MTFDDGLEDSADVLIAATGVLHHPNMPDIDGAQTFEGALFHSARWDHSIDLQDKRIAVIGNGSTGVQIISALAGNVRHIEHYQRTAQWIMPTYNGHFSEEDKARFRADPAALETAMDTGTYKKNVEGYSQVITGENGEGAQHFIDACRDNLEQAVTDPELRERLRPDHQPLCKRLVFSPDYYQAIQHPDARLVTAGIERIEPAGIRTCDGELHTRDIIVYATGFHADHFLRPIRVTGRDGIDLEDFWSLRPRAYLAVSMPGFPNLFMLNGPNGPVGNFSLIDIAEHQWHYISQLLDRLAQGECTAVEPDNETFEAFEQERIEAAKKTIWFTGGCKSWYLDAQGIPASWPWSFSRFTREMSTPRWEVFGLAEPG